MVDIYVPLVNEINRYDVPKDVHYNYYHSGLAKRKHYFKYISKKKELEEETKDLLCDYFKCGMRELGYHLQILTSEQINNIRKVYKK